MGSPELSTASNTAGQIKGRFLGLGLGSKSLTAKPVASLRDFNAKRQKLTVAYAASLAVCGFVGYFPFDFC